jgi:hypothetical protein
MDVLLAVGNGVGHELGAFDGVNHEDQIPDAFSAVGPQPALPGGKIRHRL